MSNFTVQQKDSTTKKVVEQISTSGAAHVDTNQPPAAQIIPSIASAPTTEIQIDAGTTAEVVGVRITINAGDQIVAGNRLMDHFPETYLLEIGDSIRLTASTAITTVYVIGLGTVGNSGAYSEPVALTLLPNNSTLANYTTSQVKFDFDSSDDVRYVDMTLVSYSDGTTANNLAQLSVTGITGA